MVANPISKNSIAAIGGASSMLAADYSSGDHTFTTVPRGIHVNVGGTAVVRLEDDTADRTLVLNAGQLYPYRVKIIRNSGTTAGMGIFGIY